MKFLNPCNDVAFKKIFGSEEHKSVTISFLNSILELTGNKTIVSIDFLNTEQLPLANEKKDNILDLICIDQAGTRYIVEMQVRGVREFGKRMVFYGAKTYSMQLGKGKPYPELMPVVVLSLVGFTMFSNKKKYKSIHKILDIETHENDLEELTFVFVELPKFHKKEQELTTTEDKWLYFVKEIKKQNYIPAALDEEELIEACGVAEKMSWSEQELSDYEDAFVRATDQQGEIELAEEGGEKRGKQKGLQEGIQEGRKDGEINAKRTVAQQMLQSSIYTVAEIVRITGLSEEEVVLLKK